MREMEFKMERQGLVKIGDVVDVTEREGFNYSYIIEPAVAMSGCYKSRDRLKSKGRHQRHQRKCPWLLCHCRIR